MKNVKLMLLTTMTILFLGMGEVSAQESSSVMLTVITSRQKITLQVVDDQNKTTTESFKFSDEKPDQAILKMEMDKWLKKGYKLSQAYGYGETSGSSSLILSNRYETIILLKE